MAYINKVTSLPTGVVICFDRSFPRCERVCITLVQYICMVRVCA